jgi:hypothetical protein
LFGKKGVFGERIKKNIFGWVLGRLAKDAPEKI